MTDHAPGPAPAHLSASDLETLADSLTASANALHGRLMKALREPPAAGQAPALPRTLAQTLLDQEVALRQEANLLYVQAARLAASGLHGARQDLLDLVAQARRRIRSAAMVQDLAGMTASLVGLAAALAAGKPERLPDAIRKLRAEFRQWRDGDA